MNDFTTKNPRIYRPINKLFTRLDLAQSNQIEMKMGSVYVQAIKMSYSQMTGSLVWKINFAIFV